MGWYRNYQVEFEQRIDWDDDKVKTAVSHLNCTFLYLRDLGETVRVIFCLYSQHSINDILHILFQLYHSKMRFYDYHTQHTTQHNTPHTEELLVVPF